jgi:hypothetical protein
MTVVGLTAVAALEAVGSEMRAAERARRAIEVSALATQRLDWLDLLAEQELRALPDTVAEGRFDAPFDQYAWKTETAPVSTQPGVYLVRIAVSGPETEYVLRTYAYRRPVIASRRAAR